MNTISTKRVLIISALPCLIAILGMLDTPLKFGLQPLVLLVQMWMLYKYLPAARAHIPFRGLSVLLGFTTALGFMVALTMK